MKVYSLVLVLSALLLTSCQRDELQGGSISGEEVTVSISAVVPGDGGAVVKSNDNPGNGSEVNRCILEVEVPRQVFTAPGRWSRWRT